MCVYVGGVVDVVNVFFCLGVCGWIVSLCSLSDCDA